VFPVLVVVIFGAVVGTFLLGADDSTRAVVGVAVVATAALAPTPVLWCRRR